MKENFYRVECNNGSKHFDTPMQAFIYFEKMRAKRKYSVSLWLVVIHEPLEITQTLIAYAPLN